MNHLVIVPKSALTKLASDQFQFVAFNDPQLLYILRNAETILVLDLLARKKDGKLVGGREFIVRLFEKAPDLTAKISLIQFAGLTAKEEKERRLDTILPPYKSNCIDDKHLSAARAVARDYQRTRMNFQINGPAKKKPSAFSRVLSILF